MKLILSRKGFDSKNGGMPSPIIDGAMFSLPIPSPYDRVKYEDLSFRRENGEEKNYMQIVLELNPRFNGGKTCHLDPDIRKDVTQRKPSWRPAFGQESAALTHLINKLVGRKLNPNETVVFDEPVLFLFFGLFREAEWKDGHLTFRKSEPFHAIYGYLQAEKLITDECEMRKILPDHPHSITHGKTPNGLFLAAEKLFDGKHDGAGVFSYHDSLRLTAKNQTCSRWKLHKSLTNEAVSISYHAKGSNCKTPFQSARIGQEFVVETSDTACEKKIRAWVSSLFT